MGSVMATQRKRQRGGGTALSFNHTAMIDVVFLLLVYFMTATRFKLGEEIYRMDLPQRSESASVAAFDLDESPLRILVMSVGPGTGDCTLELEGGYETIESFEELYVFLRDHQSNSRNPGGWFAADHPIVITPTGSTSWRHTVEAMNAAVRARYTNVTFAKPGA